MTNAIFTAENHGVVFTQEHDGWYWTSEDDASEYAMANGPFQTKEQAANDCLSGADNIDSDDA